jgi:hypothetical protein
MGLLNTVPYSFPVLYILFSYTSPNFSSNLSEIPPLFHKMKMLTAILLSPLVVFLTSAEKSHGGKCDCTDTIDGGPGSEWYICNDWRLGPKVLPHKLPLGTFVSDYDRFGGLTPGEFLKKWTKPDGNYTYPDLNGFQLNTNGNAINGTMVLQPGTLVDRFGGENGRLASLGE